MFLLKFCCKILVKAGNSHKYVRKQLIHSKFVLLNNTWQKKVIFLRAEVGAKKRKVRGISIMKVASTLSLCIHSGWRLAAYLLSENYLLKFLAMIEKYQDRGVGRHWEK